MKRRPPRSRSASRTQPPHRFAEFSPGAQGQPSRWRDRRSDRLDRGVSRKFKFFILVALSKGKLLLLGLTKAGTLLSMLLSFGLYWSLWGWKFAAGFIVSIYVHEMGHVAMLQRFGISKPAVMMGLAVC